MISVSGVRGIVGKSLTPQVALRWAEAFGSLCKPGPVVVGGDSRPSKTMMRAAAFSGLAGAGARIIDVGIVPTPTIGLAVRYHQARGGIAITASHNPIEWNAFKFYGDDGLFFGEQSGNALRNLVESDTPVSVKATQVGTYEKDENAVRRHLDAVLAIPFVDREAIRRKHFRVGLDAVNGAGGTLLAALLTELGCEVIGFHLDPTGIFPRNPEPVSENLAEVCRAMHEARVDVGFVVDPDADRLAIIRNDGKPAGEELTVTAAADLVLRHSVGDVVVNCSTTRAVDDIAAKYKCRVHRTKVGEAYVARKMLDVNAVIGGEGNGGVMLPQVHPARDTAVGIALILQALVESGGSAAHYFDSLPQYFLVKQRVDFTRTEELQRALDHAKRFTEFGEPDKLDGLKWSLPQGWVQIRASNTEPILRVFAEAKSLAEANALIQTIRSIIGGNQCSQIKQS